MLLDSLCAKAHVCEVVRTEYACLNAVGTVVCPNWLLPQHASMRGEIAHVWWSPRATVDTSAKEDGMSDSPKWLSPQQPSVPVSAVGFGASISFIAHEC